MDDVLRRLGIVESSVADTREDVSAIKSAFAHLATKADVSELKAAVGLESHESTSRHQDR